MTKNISSIMENYIILENLELYKNKICQHTQISV